MQQRQLRLGDILDDYCTRERRVTNHAVVAMVGADVKQTRCTTCDTEHEYKHAKVPRQRRKADSPAALYAQVAAGAPKRVTAPLAGLPPPAGTPAPVSDSVDEVDAAEAAEPDGEATLDGGGAGDLEEKVGVVSNGDRIVEIEDDDDPRREDEEGPVHRPLIRASLPREGQPPPARPIPEFTIRQPAGRPNRFRPRHQRGGQPYLADRSNGNGFGQRNAGPRHGGGRPPQGAMSSRTARRHGPGRKRSK